MYVAGFIFVAAGLYLYTFATSVYPDLLIYRLIFSIGGSACSAMLTAVLADYAGEKDRGKMAGMVGIFSGLGALVALFVFLPLVTTLSGGGAAGLRNTYMLVASLAVVFAGGLYFAMAPAPAIQLQEDNVQVTGTDAEMGVVGSRVEYSFINFAKEGLLAGRDPKILLVCLFLFSRF